MENFALGTVLFLFYFCCACCLLHSPAPAAVLQNNAGFKASDAPPDVEEVVVKEEPPGVPQAVDELLGGIDLDTLRLRPARKIASQLGIAQKVNGKDQPLAWLRAQIKKRLAEKPEEAIPVIKDILSVA